MSASVAPASTSQARAVSYSANKPISNNSDSVKQSSSNQSVDPRSAKTVSPGQGDAILSLASTDGSKTSSAKNNSGSSSIPAANRAYQDSKGGDTVLHPTADGGSDPVDGKTITLPEISVGPGGSSGGSNDGGGSVGGGGTPPVAGGGGGDSTPAQGSSGTSGGGAVPDPNADPHTRVTFQEATPQAYASVFKDNPRNAKIGDETTGAVAVGEHSGTSTDGSIWSSEKILFKNEKGVFFAQPSRPGDVVVARFIYGQLDITSATPI